MGIVCLRLRLAVFYFPVNQKIKGQITHATCKQFIL